MLRSCLSGLSPHVNQHHHFTGIDSVLIAPCPFQSPWNLLCKWGFWRSQPSSTKPNFSLNVHKNTPCPLSSGGTLTHLRCNAGFSVLLSSSASTHAYIPCPCHCKGMQSHNAIEYIPLDGGEATQKDDWSKHGVFGSETVEALEGYESCVYSWHIELCVLHRLQHCRHSPDTGSFVLSAVWQYAKPQTIILWITTCVSGLGAFNN